MDLDEFRSRESADICAKAAVNNDHEGRYSDTGVNKNPSQDESRGAVGGLNAFYYTIDSGRY